MSPQGRPGAMTRRILVLLALATALGACAAAPTPSAELIPVPTQTPAPAFAFGPEACPQALLEGRLVRHDDLGVAVQGDPNFPPTIVAWPHGWAARDVDGTRELLDDDGRVVAREGDHVSAGGGSYPPRDWFHPCGPIEFTPAS
jgi:hypothetical protein